MSTTTDMTNDMAMPMCDTTVAPRAYARPRSSWLRAVSPSATGLGLVVGLPFAGAQTTAKGTEINAKAHGRWPLETSTA